MTTMTTEQFLAFLAYGTRTGKLATTRADGRPHVVPIWFALDGETIIFTTAENTIKGKNMRRDPRVSLCVDEEVPPYAYVQIEGTAHLSADPAELLHWATRIGGRYMGEDQAEAFGQRNAVPGELIVRITPVKVIALSNIAAW